MCCWSQAELRQVCFFLLPRRYSVVPRQITSWNANLMFTAVVLLHVILNYMFLTIFSMAVHYKLYQWETKLLNFQQICNINIIKKKYISKTKYRSIVHSSSIYIFSSIGTWPHVCTYSVIIKNRLVVTHFRQFKNIRCVYFLQKEFYRKTWYQTIWSGFLRMILKDLNCYLHPLKKWARRCKNISV